MWSSRRTAWTLSALAVVLLLTAFFFGFVIPQTAARLSRPTATLIADLALWRAVVGLQMPVPQTATSVAAALAAVSVLAFAAYGIALWIAWQCRRQRVVMWCAVGLGVLPSLVSTFALPNANTDIFNYILRGRIAAVYGQNPYRAVADQFPEDPLYPYVSKLYSDRPEDKLPAWSALNVLLARATTGHAVHDLLLYRCAFLMLELGSLAAIVLVLRRIEPHAAASGAVFFAWNPVVFLYGQSKTDALMVFCFLLAVLLLVRGHRRLGMVPFALSVFVKLFTAPLLAVYLWRQVRLRRWADAAIGVLLAVGVAVALYLPFWTGPDLLVRHLSSGERAARAGPEFLRPAFLLGFVVVTLAVAWRQNGDRERLARGWALQAVYFSLFLTPLGFAWYLMTPIAILSLVTEWRLRAVMAGLACAALLLNVWYATFSIDFHVQEVFTLPRLVVYLMIPSAVVLGLLVLAGIDRVRRTPTS